MPRNDQTKIEGCLVVSHFNNTPVSPHTRTYCLLTQRTSVALNQEGLLFSLLKDCDHKKLRPSTNVVWVIRCQMRP